MAFPHKIAVWHMIDIFFDWNNYKVDLYYDRTWTADANFYRLDRNTNSFSYVNALYLYVLSPGGASIVRNIQLCNLMCPGDTQSMFSYAYPSFYISSMWGILISLIFTILYLL